MADPMQALTNSQQQAIALMGSAFDGLMGLAGGAVKAGTVGITEPTEALAKMVELVSAMGELAASATLPMQNLISSQRNLANAMESFADLQKELGEVVGKIAASHIAMLDALEGLAKPVVIAGDVIRGDTRKTPARKAPAKKASAKKSTSRR